MPETALPLVEVRGSDVPQATYSPSDQRLYIAWGDGRRILAYGALTGRPTGFEIQTPGRPQIVASEPDGRLLVVTEGDRGPSRLQIFEPRTNQWIPPAIVLPGPPGGIAFEPETRTPFVITFESNPAPSIPPRLQPPGAPSDQPIRGQIQAFNLAAGLPIGFAVGNLENPSAVVYDPFRQRLLVTEETAGRVLGFNPRTGERIFEINRLNRPSGLALSSDGRRIFVTERGAGRLVSFDSQTGRPAGLKIEGLRAPKIEAANPAAQTLFVSETIPDGRLFIWRLRAFSEVNGRPVGVIPAPVSSAAAAGTPVPVPQAAGVKQGIEPLLLKAIAQGVLQNAVEFPAEGGVRFRRIEEILPLIPTSVTPADLRVRVQEILESRLPAEEIRRWLGVTVSPISEESQGQGISLLRAAPQVIDALVKLNKSRDGAPVGERELERVARRQLRDDFNRSGEDRKRALRFVTQTAQLLGIPNFPAVRVPGERPIRLAPVEAPIQRQIPAVPGVPPLEREIPRIVQAQGQAAQSVGISPGQTGQPLPPTGQETAVSRNPTLQALQVFGESDRQIFRWQINGLVTQMDRQGMELRSLLEEILPRAIPGLNREQLRSTLDLAVRLVGRGINPTRALQYGLPAVREASLESGPRVFQRNLEILEELVTRLEAVLEVQGLPGAAPSRFPQMVLQAIQLSQQGIPYELEVTPPAAGSSVPENRTVAGPSTALEIHLVPQVPAAGAVPAGPSRAVAVKGTEGEIPPLQFQTFPDLEGLISDLSGRFPPAYQPGQMIRFIVDTNRLKPGEGDSRVLHLVQLAVWLKERNPNLPIEVAGLATAQELAAAKAQLTDPASRELLGKQIFTYKVGDRVSHTIAMNRLKKKFPALRNIHPELVVTQINGATLSWYLEALQRLGVRDLSHDLWERIEAFLISG